MCTEGSTFFMPSDVGQVVNLRPIGNRPAARATENRFWTTRRIGARLSEQYWSWRSLPRLWLPREKYRASTRPQGVSLGIFQKRLLPGGKQVSWERE
jgi:hypothetical protein